MKIAIAVFSIALIALLFAVNKGTRVTLVARDTLNVYDDDTGKQIAMTSAAGEILIVRYCVDTKSLIIPAVSLPQGGIGYVVTGNFQLIRSSVLDFSHPSPISFSC